MRKQSILKKTFQFGAFTFLSRVLALPREFLQIKFLGIGALSDAFIAAFRLPNFFRRIFAEGALSAAFIPTYVQLTKKKQIKTAHGTMSLSFIFFESIVLFLCILVFLFPHAVIKLVTPGFSHEQITYAVPLIRILFPFLFFVSSSALLSGALQSKHHFFAQSFGPVLHNMVYILTLISCIYFRKSSIYLALGILSGGLLIFILHLFLYFKHHFKFGSVTEDSKEAFNHILKKFVPSLLGVGIVEVNLFLDNVISSYLAKGSYTLLYTANRFMNLPLGIFAVAFSTVLLPHFSHITHYAPKRLKFYMLEVAKFVTWVITPTIFFLMFTAPQIFLHMLPNKFFVPEATIILICYSSGLLFYCFNKVLINMFYSLHDTWHPTLASIISTVINLVFNIIGMQWFGGAGIAASTALSGLSLTALCLFLLQKKHKITFYWSNYLLFFAKYFIQFILSIGLFILLHKGFCTLLTNSTWHSFFCLRLGYWLFTIPLFLFTMVFMFFSKNLFRIKLYFLNK